MIPDSMQLCKSGRSRTACRACWQRMALRLSAGSLLGQQIRLLQCAGEVFGVVEGWFCGGNGDTAILQDRIFPGNLDSISLGQRLGRFLHADRCGLCGAGKRLAPDVHWLRGSAWMSSGRFAFSLVTACPAATERRGCVKVKVTWLQGNVLGN